MNDSQFVRGTDAGVIHPLSLTIQDKKFTWPHQYASGAELKQLGGIPASETLYMSLTDPYDDEIIADDQRINLARSGIERFYIRQPLEFQVEKAKHTWAKPFITGAELRQLSSAEAEDEIWLKVARPYEDELIDDAKRVDLTRPEIEHFYVVKKKVVIHINYKEYTTARGAHTVTELKKLASVKATDEIDQFIGHQLTPLEDSATVHIVGGEQFFAHVRDGSSS